MTTQLVRRQAIASIVRKDMHLLGRYALVGAIGMFAASALLHTREVLNALKVLSVLLYGLAAFGLPVGLVLFTILVAQTNVVSDRHHDWLIRPVKPLELVASKAAMLFCVIGAPAIAGDLLYMVLKGASLEEAFEFFPTFLASGAIVLVLSWLVSTPFRAVLALLGVIAISTIASALAGLIKSVIQLAVAGSGGRFDLTPFPKLDHGWIFALLDGISLCVVLGITLWLLLARRKHVAARWLFVGYLAVSTFLQSFLFTPIS